MSIPLAYYFYAIGGGLLVSELVASAAASSLRDDALSLCATYLPCSRGDAHFNEMCKDYGGIGTTCGYLPSFVLYRLGCRDGRICNRVEPDMTPPNTAQNTIGKNIEKLVFGGMAVGAFHWMKDGGTPQPGDILYFGVEDGAGGISHEHVAILADNYPDNATGDLETWDLGHSTQPEGSETSRKMFDNEVTFFGGTQKRLLGYVDLDSVNFSADADLSDLTV